MSLKKTFLWGGASALSPSVTLWVKQSDLSSAGTPPVVRNCGGGLYDIDYTALQVPVYCVVDSGDDGMDDSIRYQSCVLFPGDVSVGLYAATITVADAEDNPIQGVAVKIINTAAQVIRSGLTDSNGQYIPTLDAGTFTVRCFKSMVEITDQELEIIAADETLAITGSIISPALPAVGTQTIYGHVKHGDSSAGISARIRATPAANQEIDNVAVSLKPVEVVSNTSGYFEIELLKGGVFDIAIFWASKSVSAKQITVTDDNTAEYDSYD